MKHARLIRTLTLTAIVAALTACGGGSDSNEITAVPTGGALPNVWFADSSGYHALDKLKDDGSFYSARDTNYGTVNPAYSSGDSQNSRWAIDTSASVEAGVSLQYSMDISSINVSSNAINAMKDNLRFDTNTGLITQFCTGFPVCYDNISGAEEDFLITVTAKVVGGKGSLQRNFILRVR